MSFPNPSKDYSIALCSPKVCISLPNWTILPGLRVCWLLQCIIWIDAIFRLVAGSISLVAEKNSPCNITHRGILVRKCCTEIKPYRLWVLGTLMKQNLVLWSESTLHVVSEVVMQSGVLSGLLCLFFKWQTLSISGLLKEQTLGFPTFKEIQDFFGGRKGKRTKGGAGRTGGNLSDHRSRALPALRNNSQLWLSHLSFIPA